MDHTVGVGIYRRQSVEAIVLRACRHCGAPAVYGSDDNMAFAQWAGCQVPAESPLIGKLVGSVCPNCGHARRPEDDEHLGEIWAQEFGGTRRRNGWIKSNIASTALRVSRGLGRLCSKAMKLTRR